MSVITLYEDQEITLEKFDKNNDYRITFFNEDNHWAGDITFNKELGVICDDVKDNDISKKEYQNRIIQNSPQARELNAAFIAGAKSQINKAKEKFCEVCDVKICSKMHVKCAEFIEFCKLIESC